MFHLYNLIKLNVAGYCGIDQDGINALNLIILNAYKNAKIKNVSFMINLQILYVEKNYGINQNGIRRLNLIVLKAYNNIK